MLAEFIDGLPEPEFEITFLVAVEGFLSGIGRSQIRGAVAAIHDEIMNDSDYFCKNLCEIDPDYYSAACARIERETMQEDFFADIATPVLVTPDML